MSWGLIERENKRLRERLFIAACEWENMYKWSCKLSMKHKHSYLKFSFLFYTYAFISYFFYKIYDPFFGDIVFSQFMEILLIRFVNEAWTLSVLSVKGITVFTLILLIRTSWSFFKPYLQDKEMKVLHDCDSTDPFDKDWVTWKHVFLLVHVMWSVAVLSHSPLFVLSNSKGVFGVNFSIFNSW